MQLTHLDRPLLPTERQRLWTFLATRVVPRGGMDAETLDGFFTALVLCPEPAMPEQFLTPALGPRDSDLFSAESEAEIWVSLVMRRWNELAQRLLKGQPATPWLLPGPTQGRGWARGFLRAMAVHPERWEALRQADAGRLLPLIRLAEREDAPEALQSRDRKALVADLPRVIEGVRGFWPGRA
jgi:yecA family protein